MTEILMAKLSDVQDVDADVSALETTVSDHIANESEGVHGSTAVGIAVFQAADQDAAQMALDVYSTGEVDTAVAGVQTNLTTHINDEAAGVHGSTAVGIAVFQAASASAGRSALELETAATRVVGDDPGQLTDKGVASQLEHNSPSGVEKLARLDRLAASAGFPFANMPLVGGDEIIEIGNNSNGSWIVTANGFQVAWATNISLTLNNVTRLSGVWSFPILFTSTTDKAVIFGFNENNYSSSVNSRSLTSVYTSSSTFNTSAAVNLRQATVDSGSDFLSGDTATVYGLIIGRRTS